MCVDSASQRMVEGEKFLTELVVMGGFMRRLLRVRKDQSWEVDAMVVSVKPVFFSVEPL